MPLLAGSRRIARVVLLSAAAGIALADGDLSAAVELGTQADSLARDLGIDREIPLIRCVLARAMLASGNVTGAAVTACEAIAAARSLAFSFPMALCLETAALVVLDGAAAIRPAAARLLAAAQAIRERGDRPGPVTLSAAVARARLAVGAAVTAERGAVTGSATADFGVPSARTTEPASDEAAELAVALLADLAGQPGWAP